MKYHILIIFTFFVGLISCDSTNQTSPSIEIKATHLISDYDKNPLLSDEKYEGKNLIVTGVVSHYAQLNGVIGVYLKDDLIKDWSVVCLIDTSSQPEAYSKLNQGESKTFLGISERKKDEHLVFLTNCKIK